jgi:hypothetical protein
MKSTKRGEGAACSSWPAAPDANDDVETVFVQNDEDAISLFFFFFFAFFFRLFPFPCWRACVSMSRMPWGARSDKKKAHFESERAVNRTMLFVRDRGQKMKFRTDASFLLTLLLLLLLQKKAKKILDTSRPFRIPVWLSSLGP